MAAAHVIRRLLGNRVLLYYEEGRDHDGDISLERLLQFPTSNLRGLGTSSFVRLFVVSLVGRMAGRTEGLEMVHAVAENALTSSEVPPLLSEIARSGLALIAVIENDVEAAKEQYNALHLHQGMLVPNCAGSTVDRLLGLLSQTIGNLDQSAGHFEDSLTFCRRAGYRPELAWTCCDYADTLLLRNGDGDRAKAISLLDESLAVAKEVGMKLLMERVLSRREMLIT